MYDQRLANKARATSNRKLLDGIKVQRGCKDCGYRESPVALEFDHAPGTATPRMVQGKKMGHFTVASMCYQGLDKILAEVDKCEVVCCNCHAIRTAQRRAGVAKLAAAPDLGSDAEGRESSSLSSGTKYLVL